MLVHVCSHVMFHCEPFIARLTDEGFLTRVCSQVSGETTAVRCGVVTCVAFIRTIFSCRVLGQDVTSKRYFFYPSPIALITFEDTLIAVSL